MKNSTTKPFNTANSNAMLSAVFLFLDDIREPEHAYEYTKQEIFLKQKWEVVRNFDEFKSYIEKNGMPFFISFDHDLADEHYVQSVDYGSFKEKTGYDCAKWLVEYCMSQGEQLPEYQVHSMNPVGVQNMKRVCKEAGWRVE